MGLDQYAYSTPEAFRTPVDMEPEQAILIHQWRKHPNLHGWMQRLYRQNGGNDESFNCSAVQLTADDLDHLEMVVTAGLLPETEGFFFGRSAGNQEEMDDDLAFIAKARTEVAKGNTVIYASWW